MGLLAQDLHIIGQITMAWRLSKFGSGGSPTRESFDEPEINVLASDANWAWPQALRAIFKPRGINLMMAENADECVSILREKRVHTALVDMDNRDSEALATVKVLGIHYPLLPCILLTGVVDIDILGQALKLNVFSVIDKPVDMQILEQQLNRLFIKRYGSHIFEQRPQS